MSLRAADVGWTTMSVICAVVLAGNAGALVYLAGTGRFEAVVFGAPTMVGWWWLCRGGWLRTSSGAARVAEGSPFPPPILPIVRARRAVRLAVVAGAVVVGAFVTQWVLSRT